MKKYTQIILDKLLSLLPYNINYTISFNDKSVLSLLNDDFNFIKDTEIKSTILLLQGPIINFDYVLTSLKYYISSNSYKRIVISTWVNELSILQKNELNKLELIDLVENIKPVYYGISNINLQILSTQNGLKYIQSNFPNSYVLKSRTDQRLLNVSINLYLKTLLSIYKISDPILKNRIVICNYNTYKYRIYSISDMFMFGDIFDLLLYWNVSLDHRSVTLKDIQKPMSLKSWSKLNLAEVYLATNFFSQINYNYNWTIADYWKILDKFFIVIDDNSIGLEWNKYTLNNKNGTLNQFNLRERFYNFSDWVIYKNNDLQYDFETIENKLDFYENVKIQKN
jgi:hypothetical protein